MQPDEMQEVARAIRELEDGKWWFAEAEEIARAAIAALDLARGDGWLPVGAPTSGGDGVTGDE